MPRNPKKLEKEQLVQIGRKIKETRGVHVNQKDFADKLGITQSMLSRIEGGQVEPSLATLLKLCEISGKSLDWILKEHEEPH